MEFDGPSTVKIKRIPRAGYFGISSYAKSVTTLGAPYDKKGGFKTGLTKSEEEHYEKLLNLKPGDLNRHSKWWSETFNIEHAIRLHNTKTNELVLDNPINQIKYKVMLAADKVANSEIEKNNPNALFFIDNEEAKAKAELETFNFEYEGMKLIMKCSPEEKRANLRLFGKAGIDLMSEDSASSQLYLELKRDPKNFFNIMTDSDLKTKAFIKELEEKKLIKRMGNYYKHGDDTIANSTEECVEFFKNPKNQSVKLVLETRLNKLNKGK
jgi:hypothetical protein